MYIKLQNFVDSLKNCVHYMYRIENLCILNKNNCIHSLKNCVR